MKSLEVIHWAVSSVMTTLFFMLAACLLLVLIRRFIPADKIKASHDVVGYTYGIVGVVYAVLLGFTVVNVQERFNEAQKISETEANYVTDLYRDAAMLGSPHAENIRALIITYINQVLEEEWPLMKEGQFSDKVIVTIRSLWRAYYAVDPKTDKEKIWLTESISKLNEFTNIRLQRIYNSNDSLSPILWALLYSGAAITIAFLGFFYVANFRIHLIITSLLAGLIGFMLYLIQALDSVYFGDISVKPTAIEKVKDFLITWY